MPSPTNRIAGQPITAADINGIAAVANAAEAAASGNIRGTLSNPITTTTETLPTNLTNLVFKLPAGVEHPGRRPDDLVLQSGT